MLFSVWFYLSVHLCVCLLIDLFICLSVHSSVCLFYPFINCICLSVHYLLLVCYWFIRSQMLLHFCNEWIHIFSGIMKIAAFNIQKFGKSKLSDPLVRKTLIKVKPFPHPLKSQNPVREKQRVWHDYRIVYNHTFVSIFIFCRSLFSDSFSLWHHRDSGGGGFKRSLSGWVSQRAEQVSQKGGIYTEKRVIKCH